MRRRMTGSLAAATLLAAAATVWASPASIGIYFAPDASDCDATQPIGTVLPMYVLALPGTDAANGITGAEFRMEGVPSSWWILDVTPNPLGTSFGNPFELGCTIAFQGCQQGPVVLLYTIRVLATSLLEDLVYSVQGSRSGLPCDVSCFCAPSLTLCDAPVFTIVCALGGQAFVNGGACTVAVHTATRSRVKSLYE